MPRRASDTAPEPPPPPPAPYRFVALRARDGKMLGGLVASAARTAGMDVTVARLAAVLGALTGVLAVAYVIGWIVIPKEEPETGRAIEPGPPAVQRGIRIGFAAMAILGALRTLSVGWFPAFWWWDVDFDGGGPGFGGIFGVLLIAAALAFILRRKPWNAPAMSSTAVTDPPTTQWGLGGAGVPPAAPPPAGEGWQPPASPAPSTPRNTGLTIARVVGWLVALWFGMTTTATTALWAFGALDVHFPWLLGLTATAALGLLLYVLLRTRRPELVVAAVLALTIPLTVATATARWNGSVGRRTIEPASVDELLTDYEHALGDLNLDLRDIDFPEGRTRVSASVVAGELQVYLPEDVDLIVRAEVTGGELDVLGRNQNGMELDTLVREDARTGAKSATLELDLDVRFGRIDVTRDPFRDMRELRDLPELNEPPRFGPPEPTVAPAPTPTTMPAGRYECTIPEGGGPAQCTPLPR
jgi:phage shock protein PspC (stress-responsive transcriptional regulator)/predicted membrane protein